ncbi:hypothetical protein HY633_01920 [Candidatus Uhrbacteria bacterium]|nr:hypothetical protein [Candidatus Uhrbacteria bacterium]
MKHAFRLAAATALLAAAIPVLAQEKPVTIPKPLGDVTIQAAVGGFIKNLLGFVGVIALVMFVYGGFRYMTAGGNEESVTKAKNTLVWATLGLIAVFGAYTMVNFVVSGLNQATAPPTQEQTPSGPTGPAGGQPLTQ